jgi:Cu(I)/Ag(I) efflux system membrane fusion protein
VTNPGGILKPEMFVRGTVETNKPVGDDVMSVPKTAVMWTGPRSVVYVEVPDVTIPSYEFREVTLGEGSGSSYFIKEGLVSGERVVVNGAFVIDAAAQLNNMTSMMNRNVRIKGVDHTKHLPDYTETTPIDFKQQLVRVSDAYIVLKDALVATDSDRAAKEATRLGEALTQVDMSLVDGDAHLYWMEQVEALGMHGKKIGALTDVEEQRKQFDFLSQALIKTIKVFGVPEGRYYIQHCPMAINDQGADWISKEKEIRNPYFGEVMLTCGLVQDTITKAYKNISIPEPASNRPPGHSH